MHTFVQQAFGAILERCLVGVGPSARVGLEIRHPGLNTTFYVPFGRRDQLNADTIAQKIEDVLNSDNDFSLDEQMIWKFTIVDDTSGAGTGTFILFFFQIINASYFTFY